MKKLNILGVMITLLAFTFAYQANAQQLSGAVQLGWSIPGGGGVSDEPEDLNLDGGLTYGVDVLYHFTESLGVGLVLNRSILAGAGGGDIDIFGMRIFGVKGHWRLKQDGFSPYGALTLGAAQLLTPELTITDVNGTTNLIEELTATGLGIMPEVGVHFGNFFINAQYMVPVQYTIEEVLIEDAGVGLLNINVGYRYYLDL